MTPIRREAIQDRGKVRTRTAGALSTEVDPAAFDTVFSDTAPTGRFLQNKLGAGLGELLSQMGKVRAPKLLGSNIPSFIDCGIGGSKHNHPSLNLPLVARPTQFDPISRLRRPLDHQVPRWYPGRLNAFVHLVTESRETPTLSVRPVCACTRRMHPSRL